MAFKFNLAEKFTACLKEQAEQKLTSREIAEWIFKNYPEDCERKRADSTQNLSNDSALISQISFELKPHLVEKNVHIKITAGRPRQFYWTEKDDAQEIEQDESTQTEAGEEKYQEIVGSSSGKKLSEHEIYPLLGEYLLSELNVFSRRIDEKRSSNNRGENGNKWLHPDMVGLKDLSRDWCKEVQACAPKAFSEHILLWSFEVKLKLNSSNVREAFFQAVSNSSWAHYGYLVATEINKRVESELNILCKAHNIGLIWLNIENLSDSQILIPVVGDKEIDWNTVNRIAEENSDFKTYLRCIKAIYGGSDIADQKGWHSLKNNR